MNRKSLIRDSTGGMVMVLLLFLAVRVIAEPPAPTAAGQRNLDEVAIVRTKTGREFTLVVNPMDYRRDEQVFIGIRQRSGRGFDMGSAEQDFALFPIKVDIGDGVKKVLSLEDGDTLSFGTILNEQQAQMSNATARAEKVVAVFAMAVQKRDGKRWDLSLKGGYLYVNANDGIRGVDRKEGAITIPFTSLASVKVLKPSAILMEAEARYMTEAEIRGKTQERASHPGQ